MSELDSERGQRALLQGIAEVTRALYSAQACSIMSHDPESRELVFEAVAGAGAGTLVGRRLADNTGLAGWALASEEPLAVGDVSHDPRFDREVAESTGYVPRSLVVYPLLWQERTLGVLNVLDQSAGDHVGLADMDVLALIASHAAGVLSAVLEARRAQTSAGDDALAALRRALENAGPGRRGAAEELLEALQRLI